MAQKTYWQNTPKSVWTDEISGVTRLTTRETEMSESEAREQCDRLRKLIDKVRKSK